MSAYAQKATYFEQDGIQNGGIHISVCGVLMLNDRTIHAIDNYCSYNPHLPGSFHLIIFVGESGNYLALPKLKTTLHKHCE